MSRAIVPKLCHAKSTNQAYVTLHGKRHYLGVWGLETTEEGYRKLLAEYMVTNRVLVAHDKERVQIVQLVAAYLEYQEKTFGRGSKTYERTVNACRDLLREWRYIEVKEFGPLKLRALRDVWISRELARRTINHYTAEVKRLFKWGVSFEMVPPEVSSALSTVEGL